MTPPIDPIPPGVAPPRRVSRAVLATVLMIVVLVLAGFTLFMFAPALPMSAAPATPHDLRLVRLESRGAWEEAERRRIDQELGALRQRVAELERRAAPHPVDGDAGARPTPSR